MRSIFRIPNQNYRRRTIIIWGICAGVFVLPVILLFVVLESSYEHRITNISLHDFPGTIWECRDPFIHLQVEKNMQVVGYTVIDGEEIPVECTTQWGGIFHLYRCDKNASQLSPNTLILRGTCKCTKDKVAVTVSKDYVFEPAYRTFTLFRVGELENTDTS